MRRLVQIVVLLGAVGTMAACGGSDSSSSTTAKTPSSAAGQTSTTAAGAGGGDCVANGQITGGPGTTWKDAPTEHNTSPKGKPAFDVQVGDVELSIGYSSNGERLNAQLSSGAETWIGAPDLGGTFTVPDDGSGATVQAPLRSDNDGPDVQLDIRITC